jgi:mono/diheme cytochrome c family protein
MKTPVALYMSALFFSIVVPGAVAGRSAQPTPKPDYNSGDYLYRTFCASCHGESGRGDGPAAPILQQPLSDLTTMTKRAGGLFPRDRVRGIIDGREPVAGHDNPEMPKWGRVLRSIEGNDDRLIRQRIDALVKHLESIQRK